MFGYDIPIPAAYAGFRLRPEAGNSRLYHNPQGDILAVWAGDVGASGFREAVRHRMRKKTKTKDGTSLTSGSRPTGRATPAPKPTRSDIFAPFEIRADRMAYFLIDYALSQKERYYSIREDTFFAKGDAVRIMLTVVGGHDDAPVEMPYGRYIVVNDRLWVQIQSDTYTRRTRAVHKGSDGCAPDRREGSARRGSRSVQAARKLVDEAKIALGERGEVWWDDGAPDYGRKLVKNTRYAQWWTALVNDL